MAALLCVALAPVTAFADGRAVLGWGRLFDNDAIGDLQDRWRTGSYTLSVVTGSHWSGHLAPGFGDIVEFRLSAQTIAASNLVSPAPDDRRYVGALSFGMHSHFDLAGTEASLGADVIVIGPQTGLGHFQSWVHGILGLPKPLLADQIANAVYPTVSAEIGKSLAVSSRTTARPFVSAEAGVETLIRVGADVVVGTFGNGSLMARDDATGQRYRIISGDPASGTSITVGGDVARVFNSAYLPAGGAAALQPVRTRLRVGMQWQRAQASVFYGLAYLGPEFRGQSEGQVVGSLNLNLRF